MFFQEQSLQEPIAVAMNVIYSLAPAFAAGFAIQRLLEILDSWISITKRVGTEWKGAILNAVSLVVGIALAYKLGIRVLDAVGQSLFGPDVSEAIDYFVSGLIISAGTEGLNSIVKFLSYAKEVKKAEAVTEAETAVSTRGLRSRALFSAAALEEIFPITGDPKADLETCLHDGIKKQWPTKFIEKDWDKRHFKAFETTPEIPKIVIGRSTRAIANGYGKEITSASVARLQSLVSIETKPEEILPEMLVVVLSGTP